MKKKGAVSIIDNQAILYAQNSNQKIIICYANTSSIRAEHALLCSLLVPQSPMIKSQNESHTTTICESVLLYYFHTILP